MLERALVKSKTILYLPDGWEERVPQHVLLSLAVRVSRYPRMEKAQQHFLALQGLLLFEKRDTSDPTASARDPFISDSIWSGLPRSLRSWTERGPCP